jgi:hypothetical protein
MIPVETNPGIGGREMKEMKENGWGDEFMCDIVDILQ